MSICSKNEDGLYIIPPLDGHLKFKEMQSEQIINKVRGLYPWPGTFCFLNKKRLKVFEVLTSDLSLKPGEVSSNLGQIHIGTLDSAIRLKYIQLEGKKACLDSELLNGLKQGFELH